MDRYRAIGLLAQGVSEAELARRFGVSREAVRKWKNAYLADRLEPLQHGRPPRLALAKIAPLIAQALRSPDRFGLPRAWTLADLAALLGRRFRVRYTFQHVQAILQRLGYRFERTVGWKLSSSVPAGAGAPPWGYCYDLAGQLARDEKEQRITGIVRHMRLVSRMTVREIVADLEAMGVRDRGGRPFRAPDVVRMVGLRGSGPPRRPQRDPWPPRPRQTETWDDATPPSGATESVGATSRRSRPA